MFDSVIRNGLCWVNQAFIPTHVYVKDGKIAKLSSMDFEAKTAVDASGFFVIPGLIDPHTHFGLVGKNQISSEGFHEGTKKALRGGMTTIIDFLEPCQSVNDILHAFHMRKEAAMHSHCDYTFHACLKEPQDSLESIVETVSRLSLKSIKVFTTYSESNRQISDPSLYQLLKVTKAKDILVTAHIENDELIIKDPTLPYPMLGQSRPTQAETLEALKLASYVKQTQSQLYMVHVSSGQTVVELIKKYPELIHSSFHLESCPHYFTFHDSVYTKPNGYLYVMAPPLRSPLEQELLIQNFPSIETIGTDHCHYPAETKHKTHLAEIPYGVGGIEHSFAIMYTQFGNQVIDKMSRHVAKLFGLQRKGQIAEGFDADLVLFQKIDPTPIRSSEEDIYAGQSVNIKIQQTILRGITVMKDGRVNPHKGQFIGGMR